MSKKKSFVLRIDPETFKQIEEWMITQSLKQNKRLKSKPNTKPQPGSATT